MDQIDKTYEIDEIDKTDEMDQIGETDELDEMDQIDDMDQIDGTDRSGLKCHLRKRSSTMTSSEDQIERNELSHPRSGWCALGDKV